VSAPRKLPSKKEVALALLESSSVFVHLDPRRDGVVVPKGFTRQPQLVLQIGLNMAVPIRDLDVGDDGITCTLSFSRTPFWCSLPWTAIFALVSEDGRGGIWPEDVPSELATQVQRAADEAKAAPPPPPPAKKPRPKLAAVGRAAPSKAEDEGIIDDVPAEARSARKPELVAIPGPRPAPAPAPVAEEEPAAPAPAEPDATAVPGKKPRRELPPYLRVVK
jgi:stringent starvation protein B